jgi:hypothetical protein
VSVTVNPANFTFTATPSSQTITDGQTAQFRLTVTPQGSLTTPINFACDGLPAMTTCSFSPASVTPDTNTVTTTLTIKTVGNAMAPTVPLLPRFGHRDVYPLGALAAVLMALIAILLAGGGTNRRLTAVIPACILLLVLVSLAACAGNAGKASNSSGSSTPLGTTKVTVTATATAGSGTVNHSTALTLTIQ